MRSLKDEENTIESLDESSKSVVIEELTTKTFKNFIMTEDKVCLSNKEHRSSLYDIGLSAYIMQIRK